MYNLFYRSLIIIIIFKWKNEEKLIVFIRLPVCFLLVVNYIYIHIIYLNCNAYLKKKTNKQQTIVCRDK